MVPRSELQTILENLLGSTNVYFQPPENIKLVYPAIVYERDYSLTHFSDNEPYSVHKRYLIKHISRNPDDPTPDKIARLPLCTFDRFYKASGLNHDLYKIYF